MESMIWIARPLIVVGFLIGFSAALKADWPQFRGPHRNGIAGEANPPVSWSQGNRVRWRTAIPGVGWSSPVVSKGRIYLTTAKLNRAQNPTTLNALCIDARSGKLLWDKIVRSALGERKKHSKNSFASPTPIVHQGRLYLHFGHLGSACLDLDGKTLWRQTEISYEPVHGNGGSPVIEDGKLIFSADGKRTTKVYALDLRNGQTIWYASRNTSAKKKFSFSTPTILNDEEEPLIISPGSGAVSAYRVRDGKEIWSFDYGEGYSVIPQPIVAHDLVFVGTGYDKPSVLAIELGGHGDITESHLAWKTNRSAPHTPSMLCIGNELYFVSDGGVASCVDARTGKRHWQERIGGNVSASPLYANGRIYITSEEGVTTVLRAKKEFDILARNDLKERSLASLAVDGDAFIARTMSYLYRIE